MTLLPLTYPEFFKTHGVDALILFEDDFDASSEYEVIATFGPLVVIRNPHDEWLDTFTTADKIGIIGNVDPGSLHRVYVYLALKALWVDIKTFNQLPAEIGQLVKLTSLNLSGNQLTALPTAIGQLTQLTSLDLSLNELTDLPAELWQLTQLTSLNLSYNRLTALPAAIGQLTQLISLILSGNQLTALPATIGQLTQLKSLNLSSNQLPELPAEIGQLTQLTSLNLSSNRLTALPATIGQLTQLTLLDLSLNELTAIPAKVGQLTQLKSLDLSYNSLTALPTAIGQLTQLASLDLSRNQLTALPAEIGQLTQLTSLDLSRNQLTALPAEIGQLVRLESLIVSSRDSLGNARTQQNTITKLPREMQNLRALKKLDLRDNGLDIPPEILDKVEDPPAILGYLAWLWDGKRRALGETKLLVVGQGSVGKTSLIKRMMNATFDLQEIKTDGIAIDHWRVANRAAAENPAPEIAVHVWDFGGQEIMHATHQFFLTKRSLYLLVLDARLTQEENRVEYWLKIIQSFGGESPVLVVGNKIDQHPLDIDRRGLSKKYLNLVGFFETSAATGAGLAELTAALTEQVNALPHVRDALPETWFNVKAKLEALGREQNFITHDRYLDLCAAEAVPDETSQRTLVGFLHDLGVVLHFQDDPRLEALGILNPQWVTNGVYKILNAPLLFQHQGVLQRPILDEILNLPDYPAHRRLFIVDMMRKFELCYDIEPDQIFLVPDLLPKDEPDTGDWSEALAFQYHYTVLPSSILTRFIVRMSGFIHDTKWRSGVVLKNGGNLALVKADTEDRKVYLWVNGDPHSRRDFLAKIRGEFDAIHKTIARIEVTEKVPLPGSPEAEPVDYDLLLQMEHDGDEFHNVLAGRKKIRVNVGKLLSGVVREADRHRSEGGVHFYTNGDIKIEGDVVGRDKASG